MRALSLLLGTFGAVAALFGWKLLVPLIVADPAGASMAVRLGQGCAALLPGVAVLALMIVAQMGFRVTAGAVDPLAGRDTRLLRTNQRAISNTVEQLAVFAPALLALSAGVVGPRMADVIALGVVFAVARAVFWLGYLVAPVARAPGMAGTLVATLGALFAAGWAWTH